MVTDHQVKSLFKYYGQTGNIQRSAMRSGMNRKTASKYIYKKKLPSGFTLVRDWRTRRDPLIKIWEKSKEFLKDAPELEAKSLFEYLLEQYPDQIDQSHLRTFQRRVKSWRLKEGKEKEVFFDQNRSPGECMQLDWTDMNKLGIVVAGEHYLHKLCHLVLPYSNYEGAVRCRSESILSIKKGINHFLYSINATPKTLQVDNSSAATHQINKSSLKREFNDDFVSIANYYDFSLRTTNVDCPNENGDVESLNGHLKKRIKQALLLRKSTAFDSMEDYDHFLQTVFDKANKTRIKKLQEELRFMKSIPNNPLPEYQEIYVTVRSGSTIRIKKVVYSVPSRLIGQKLKARINENTITLYEGANLVHKMPRMLGDRGQVIDYRHIIHSLVRKPAAFESYKYREEMYPSDIFRTSFDNLVSIYGDRKGCLEYLRILKLAAETMESEVETALCLLLGNVGITVSYKEVESLVNIQKNSIPDMGKLVPDLTSYDDLIKGKDDYDICTNQSTIAKDTQALGHGPVLSGSDDQIQKGRLVPGEDIAKSTRNRGGLPEGEKNRKSDQTIWNTTTVHFVDTEPEIIDTETSKNIDLIVGRKFCGQRGECADVWVAR